MTIPIDGSENAKTPLHRSVGILPAFLWFAHFGDAPIPIDGSENAKTPGNRSGIVSALPMS